MRLPMARKITARAGRARHIYGQCVEAVSCSSIADNARQLARANAACHRAERRGRRQHFAVNRRDNFSRRPPFSGTD